jgi:AbrB family looped-hinge helix DNA binding protein
MEVENMLAKVTTKGQVTIPKKIRDALQIQPNDRVDFDRQGEKIIMVPVKTLRDFRGAVKARLRGNAAAERAKAKKTVAKRVVREMQ